MKANIASFLRAPLSMAATLLTIVIVMGLFAKLTNYDLIRGNLGQTRLSIELTAQVLLSILFGVFVGLNVFRYRYFRSAKAHLKQSSVLGPIGAIIGALVVGCPACGFTIAGYLGLIGFLAFLPFGGEELKWIGIILLLIANYFLLRDLRTCKVKKC